MDREILFRGKRVIDGKWVESCCPLGEMHSGTVTYDFIQKTVCQYTGKTDKNGKKIFENDIVRCTYYICGEKGTYIGKVIYKEHNCLFLVTDGEKRANLRWWDDELEVIGNIFDNPELIGEQQCRN